MAAEFSFGTLNYLILFAYLCLMLGIGLRLSRRQTSTEEYFLAGRRMPWLVVALSMFASLTSSITYMGVPGTVYDENTSFVLAAIISPIVAPFLIYLFYPFYRRLKVTTSYEYVERRYGSEARYAVCTLFLLARLGWLGTVIYVPAMTLSVVTGIDLTLAILLMGILATTYTVMGGLAAVLWTDVLQFVILMGGALWVALELIQGIPGGVSGILEVGSQAGRVRIAEWTPSLYEMTAPVILVSYFFQYMQEYGTDQVTVQRLLAVKTFRGMVKSVVFNSFIDFFILVLLTFVGLGLFVYFQQHPQELAPGLGRNQILPFYIMAALPQGVSGLVITGIFAAAMSSMDSGINSVTTVVINDFIKPLRKGVGDERSAVRLARMCALALGTFATVVSFIVSYIEDILQASQTFLGLFSGPVLALFLLGILTRRANFRGWLVGTVLALSATLWVQISTEVHWIWYFMISFTTAASSGFAFSLVLREDKADRSLTLWGRSALGPLE